MFVQSDCFLIHSFKPGGYTFCSCTVEERFHDCGDCARYGGDFWISSKKLQMVLSLGFDLCYSFSPFSSHGTRTACQGEGLAFEAWRFPKCYC